MKYYLTTPIYYVNAAPHIGTAYSTFVADLVKRYKKMQGFDPVVLTTGSDEHSRNVERAAKAANLSPEFERCQRNGYVYKGSYTGQYCVSDELYVNDAKPGDPCPDCGRPTETVTEENYFFKLSAFAEKLLKHHEDNPDFIQPDRAATKSSASSAAACRISPSAAPPSNGASRSKASTSPTSGSTPSRTTSAR
jgi:methionyl-tRNA synthetase